MVEGLTYIKTRAQSRILIFETSFNNSIQYVAGWSSGSSSGS